MSSSVLNNQSQFLTALRQNPPAGPAQKQFFQSDIYPTLALRFFTCKDVAKLAPISRLFQRVSIPAAEYKIRAMQTIHYSELYDFARLKSHQGSVDDFRIISPYLDNLTEVDFSFLDFAHVPFLHLSTLSEGRLRAITSLKFISAQNLTPKKVKSLLVGIPLFNASGAQPGLFPHLTHLNFWRADFEGTSAELINECDLPLEQKGTWTFFNGERYERDLFVRPKNGNGACTYLNGAHYEGQWREGERHGLGIYTHPGGTKYEGQWRKGKPDGQGAYTHANGSKYVGEWLNGKQSGHGIMTHPDGEEYQGEWLAGKPHGQGRYTYPDGTKDVGRWLEGELI